MRGNLTVNGRIKYLRAPLRVIRGVHSLGEQWENMSTSSTASEQYNRPNHGNVSGRRVSDSRVPPNTDEDEDINYPWTDCLLNKGLDDNVSIDIQHKDINIQHSGMTVCENEYSSVDSGTDGVNSDIRALADLSDDDEETRVEQPSGCRIPGTNVYGTNVGRMVIAAMKEMDRDDANFSENNYPDPVKQIAREITDFLLNKGLVDTVSIDIQHKDRNIQYNGMTVCENE